MDFNTAWKMIVFDDFGIPKFKKPRHQTITIVAQGLARGGNDYLTEHLARDLGSGRRRSEC